MKRTNESSGLNRRLFLGATGSALIAPLILPAGTLAASPNSKLDIAFIGMGAKMQGHLENLINMGHNAVAFCDADLTRAEAAKKQYADNARIYQDYRNLFDRENSFDAVVVATPDHWHAPIIKNAFETRKHIYCEKPLTHTIAEAREIREMDRKSDIVTQTGNQGSASANMRRSLELIEAGLFGQITDIYIWHIAREWMGDTLDIDEADPIPAGLNWDLWCGPSLLRPYKKDLYHPKRWRDWFAYGSGFLGDFCCHTFNLPVRALKLEYPTRIDIQGENFGSECVSTNAVVDYHFPKRGDLEATNIHIYDGGRKPENNALDDLIPTFGEIPRTGCLLHGEKGQLSAGLWNTACYVKMEGDEKFVGADKHPAARQIPERFPRVRGHMIEWVDAVLEGKKTFSDFDLGGHLTEIGLAGTLALRMGESIAWDGKKMEVLGRPDAQSYIRAHQRQKWL